MSSVIPGPVPGSDSVVIPRGAGEAHRLLERFRPRLRRLIALRLDARVRSRVDASDVIQEALVDVDRRLTGYLDHPDVSFYVWVRFLTLQKLAELHRAHLGRACRDVRRELGGLDSSSVAGLEALPDAGPSPSEVLMSREHASVLFEALERLGEADREIIALRHLEALTNVEVAEVLGLGEPAASQRYSRALGRLGAVLRAGAATAPDPRPAGRAAGPAPEPGDGR